MSYGKQTILQKALQEWKKGVKISPTGFHPIFQDEKTGMDTE